MIRRAGVLVIVALFAVAMVGSAQTPFPTLISPTLAPTTEPAPPAPRPSATRRIVDAGIFRAGVLYNDPPFSELGLGGDLQGFDVDLLRLIAEAWGVDLQLIQVTRLNAIDKLNAGAVDAVASALVRYRDLDELVGFTQSYHIGQQALMVNRDSAFNAPGELLSHSIGYVLGTRAAKALDAWLARQDLAPQTTAYLTLDRALSGLTNGAVAAVIGERHALRRVSAPYPTAVRVLDEPALPESRAIATRRDDIAMRRLLNHTLQYLAREGELDALLAERLPEEELPVDALAQWSNIGDAPPHPPQYLAAATDTPADSWSRLRDSGRIRVGLFSGGDQAADASQLRVVAINRALVEDMARRWGVDVTFVPGVRVDALANGEVDVIGGMSPDWQLARQHGLTFSAPYLLHGDRLMAPANAQIAGFNDLRGRWIGIMIGDDDAESRAQVWADSINVSVRFFKTRAANATATLLENENADVIYADSMALLPHLEANPNALKLTDRWYSREYLAFGMRAADVDLRLLLDHTLGEMVLDGALERITRPLLLSDGLPAFEVVPGDPSFRGFKLHAP